LRPVRRPTQIRTDAHQYAEHGAIRTAKALDGAPAFEALSKVSHSAVSVERVSRVIVTLRGQRVILDRDLAAIYGVTTGRLNEAVKRGARRFPKDFMFRLTREEAERSRSQFAILKGARGQNIKYLPHAFTEHGAIQVANVLSSPRAIQMGIYVVRAFVKLRELLVSNKELAHRLDALEVRIEKKLTTHDEAIAAMLSAIRQLMNPPLPRRRGIGFTADLDKG
jgi:hypothetical protein